MPRVCELSMVHTAKTIQIQHPTRSKFRSVDGVIFNDLRLLACWGSAFVRELLNRLSAQLPWPFRCTFRQQGPVASKLKGPRQHQIVTSCSFPTSYIRGLCPQATAASKSKMADDGRVALGLAVGAATIGVVVSCIHSSTTLPPPWNHLSDILGFTYTAAWSVSFYPQLILNFKLRSVRGLSLDFQLLNMLGFACYAAYNVSLFCVPSIRAEYQQLYSSNIPVGLEDVVFSVHACFITALTLFQCMIYDRGGQRFGSALGKAAGGTVVAISIAAITVAVSEYTDQLNGYGITWIRFLLALSLIKLIVSLVKYIPQVIHNQARKSTLGWSITNVLLDFTGGTLSLAQLLMQCSVLNDWSQIVGNPVKFGLGFVSLSFDLVFMAQHWILFPHTSEDVVEAEQEENGPSGEETRLLVDPPGAPVEATESDKLSPS